MNPWKLEQFVQRCAKWIYFSDKNFAQNHLETERLWLAPSVLTPTNPDKSNPQIPVEDARAVFDILEKRFLLMPWMATVTDSRGEKFEVTVFIVNRDRRKEWEALVYKSGFWNLKASPLIYYFFGKERPLFWLFLVFFSAAFFGEIFKSFGGDIYSWLKQIINPKS